MNYKIKDATAAHDKELEATANRVTGIETACKAIQEELIEVKIAAERGAKLGVSRARSDYQ